MLKEKGYDERQLAIRYKLAFETLLFTFLLIFINGMIKMSYTWATPGVEMYALITIPVLYYVARSIMTGSYLPINYKNYMLSIILSLFIAGIGLFNFIILAVSQNKPLIENGMLTDVTSHLFLVVLFGFLSLFFIYKKMTQKEEK